MAGAPGATSLVGLSSRPPTDRSTSPKRAEGEDLGHRQLLGDADRHPLVALESSTVPDEGRSAVAAVTVAPEEQIAVAVTLESRVSAE